MVPVDELEVLLAAHPDAWVAALGPNSRYVPLPDGAPVAGHRVLEGGWALDLVIASDRVRLAGIWRARADLGTTVAEVELRTGGTATFHVFHVADDLGADVLVVVPHEGADIDAAIAAPLEVMPSRFCRIIRDADARTLEIDDAAPLVLRYSAENLLSQQPPLDRIHPDDHAVILENWVATLANETDGHRCRVRVIRGDGTVAWFEFTNYNRLDDPVRPHVISEMLDISEEMAAHEAVAAREQLLHRLAAALPLGVLQMDPDRQVIYKNDYLDWILGTDAATTLDGQFFDVVDDDRPLLEKAFGVALEDGADDDVVVRLSGAALGRERIVRVITKSLHATGGDVSGVIACVSDVTEATLMSRELERRATFDGLTGCFNRAAVLGRLASALSADGGPGGVAAIFLDLDGFKGVNDSHGHAVGDELLKAVAQVLLETIRPSDVVGRLGGDEFLVVCQDVADDCVALDLARRVAEAVRRQAELGTAQRASVGVAWAVPGTVDADHLVHRADEAMYESKREAEGCAHLWAAVDSHR